MGLLSNNKNFYPTPSKLAGRMIAKVKGNPAKILEPSAGKGDLIEYYTKATDQHSRYGLDISAIEIDNDLQATLRGNRIKVIDSDFLAFAGMDKFDLIIANPPFDEGDLHLLKAIDIMYRGQIVFLLNAETIRNPYTNTRKELVKKLSDLNAVFEYHEGAFKDAERPTGVEVVIVYINIERQVEDDLFAGATDRTSPVHPTIENDNEITTRRAVDDLVAEYNQVINIGLETITAYFKNYRKIWKYIGLNNEPDKYQRDQDDNLTTKMQNQVNSMLIAVRTDFWRRTLDLPEVKKRLTESKRNEFEEQITKSCDLDFTASNIRQFILNLIGGYEKTITEAVLDIFDMFTKRHCFSDGLYDENVHYFNGWKTNKAFKVNRRVIIPIYGSFDKAFTDYRGWKLNYKAASTLNDIDTVMSYFDGMKDYYSMSRAIDAAFETGKTTRIKSDYFTVNCYRKGTIHLTFNDEDILRRFNVVACKGKTWLPHDYGKKPYDAMDTEEREVVNQFEGAMSYAANCGRPLFAESATQLLQLTA